jgi:hypothetical protein
MVDQDQTETVYASADALVIADGLHAIAISLAAIARSIAAGNDDLQQDELTDMAGIAIPHMGNIR